MEAWVALAPYIIEVQEADSDQGFLGQAVSVNPLVPYPKIL